MRFYRYLTCGGAIVTMFVVAAVSAAAAEAPLRWKFTKGEVIDYVMLRGVEGKMNLMGADINFKMNLTFDVNWKVESVASDGTGQLELVVERVQVAMDSPLGGSLTYDSKQPGELTGPAAAMMGPVIKGMLGQPFHFKISPLGAVSDIELPEKLAASFKKEQSQNRQQGFGMGGSGFSERGLKELIAKSVLPLPEAAPGKEVTWKQHFENPIMRAGTQATDITFSFAGNETQDGKPLAKIAATTEMTFEPDENPMADVEITSQEGSSTFYFDPAAGRMVKSDGVQKFVFEISGAREMTQDIKETWNMHIGKSPEAKASEPAKTVPAAK